MRLHREGEAPVLRHDVLLPREVFMLGGVPHMEALGGEAGGLEGQGQRRVCLRGLNDDAVVFAIRGFERDDIAAVNRHTGAVQVFPAWRGELRGVRHRPDRRLDSITA